MLRYILFVLVSLQYSWGFAPSSNNIGSRISKPTLAPSPESADVNFSSSGLQGSARAINNRHSASDWLYNLKTLPSSSVLKETRNPVLSLAAWATGVSLVHKLLLVHGRTQFALNLSVPHAAHSFVVSSLGLLLVFRTNSAYQRFLEGRKIWEQILTTSRNFARLSTLYRSDVGIERLGRIKNLLASFPYLLRHHVRSGCLCSNEAERIDEEYKLLIEDPVTVVDSRYEGDKACGGAYRPEQYKTVLSSCYVDRRELPWSLLDDAEGNTLNQVSKAVNRPLWICDRIGTEIMGIQDSRSFSSRERLALLGSVDMLTSAIGQCERIHQTSVPLNYARHALRSLTLWLVTLPFCLVKDLGLLTGPVTGIIAWLLFGIYQIGHSIEDPFQGSLRLAMLCDHIRRDVLAAKEPSVDQTYLSFGSNSYSDLDNEDEEEDDYDFYNNEAAFANPVLTGQVGDLNKELDMIFPADIGAFDDEEPRLVLQKGAWRVAGVDNRRF